MGRYAPGESFYDHVVDRMARHTPEQIAALRAPHEKPDPEEIFTAEVQRRLAPADVVLDLGTGDATWLMREVAPHCSRALGVDNGRKRLQQGAALRYSNGPSNVEPIMGDAACLPLPDEAVSVLISRRGPLSASEEFFAEACRVLKPGGLVLEITIGEQNAREVGELFGQRWQMYEAARRGPRLHEVARLYRAHGIELTHQASLITSVYLPSAEALAYMLWTTPTVQSFDPEADAALVKAICAEAQMSRGIRITSHRLIFCGRKRK